jgi:hypothetical protein
VEKRLNKIKFFALYVSNRPIAGAYSHRIHLNANGVRLGYVGTTLGDWDEVEFVGAVNRTQNVSAFVSNHFCSLPFFSPWVVSLWAYQFRGPSLFGALF